MNRIIINEEDLTTNRVDISLDNTVYIPGFAGADCTTEKGIPVLCTSVGQFYNAFGRIAPYFKTDQLYPVYTEASGSGQEAVAEASGFSQYDIPYEPDGNQNPDVPVMCAANSTDPSYVYAVQLLLQGIPVVYERMNEVLDSAAQNYDVTVDNAYKYLANIFVPDITTAVGDFPLAWDKAEYDITFITSGGYPALNYKYAASTPEAGNPIVNPISSGTKLETLMAACARYRGDCVAVIDHTNNPHRPLEGTGSVIASGVGVTGEAASYSAVFTPWCNCTTTGTAMPGSYVYFCTLANSLRSNPIWAAVAGVSRGLASVVSSLNTDRPLTNRVADSYQTDYTTSNISINPITYIRPYGYTIWGNRTLNAYVQNSTGFATTFLNLRLLVSQVKKQAYISARQSLFEVNNDILWTNFKASMATLLDQMVTSNGLERYKMIKLSSADKTKLKCQIILYPTYNVESVEITVTLTDEDLVVSDNSED